MKLCCIDQVPKYFHYRDIQLEFHGNIDNAILAMLLFPNVDYDYFQKMQLKVCYLFLYGMSFSQISEFLGISKSVISNYLHGEELLGYLTYEYRCLLYLNSYRFNLNCKDLCIKKAVRTYVAQNGDYAKTCEITGFSERSLSRYLNYSQLENVLDDPILYSKFLDVRGQRESTMKSMAGYQGKITCELNAIVPGTLVEKRYLRLARAILLDHIVDINQMSEYVNMSCKNIRRYLDNWSLSEHLFSDYIMRELKLRSIEIIRNCSDQNSKQCKQDYDLSVISFYMAGRYSYGDICEIFEFSRTKADSILDIKSKVLLSEEDYLALCQHKKTVNHLLKVAYGNSRILIRDWKMIQVVKPEIVFLKQRSELSLLDTLLRFLDIYRSLRFGKIDVSLLPLVQILSSNMEQLKYLLQASIFDELQGYLNMELMLSGMQVSAKNKFVEKCVRELFVQSFDLDVCAQHLNIPVESLISILYDKYISVFYGEVVYQYIQKLVCGYQEYNRQNMHKDKMDLHQKSFQK